MFKNKIRKAAALCTAILMTVSVLSGCNQNIPDVENDNTSTSSITSAAADTEKEESAVTGDVQLPETEEPGVVVSVTAESMNEGLIAADTAFCVKTETDTEPEVVMAALEIDPPVPFEVEKTGEKDYRLKTSEAFPENSIAVISLKNDMGDVVYKWAFQTEGRFQVKSTMPGDGNSYVNPKTGIEIEFTSPVDAETAEKYIEITPEVKGTFKARRSKVYFIPSEPLKENTSYTVKINKELISCDSVQLGNDHSFSFETSGNSRYNYCYSSGVTETFIKGDTVLAEIYCSDGIMNTSFNVNIYRYDTPEAYSAALKKFVDSGLPGDKYKFETSGLESVYSGDEMLIPSNYSYGPGFLLFPENLDEGYYLADIKAEYEGEEYHIQRHVQINLISVYAAQLEDKVLLFANDTTTGKPADGAEVSIYTANGNSTAKTDENGVAEIKMHDDKSEIYLVEIKKDGVTYCEIFEGYFYDEGKQYEDIYYSYIYTDREIYRTDDTINLWGVIRPRKEGITVPEDLSIHVGDSYSTGWDVPVKLNNDGTFSAQISFKNAGFTWGTSIYLASGDERICSKYVFIEDFVKPVYSFESSIPDYVVSPQSDPVSISMDAEFFDGTPANGISFETTGYFLETVTPSEMVTDDNGHAEAELIFSDQEIWHPQYINAEVRLSGVQNEYTNIYLSTIGFFRDVMLEYEYDEDSDRMDISTSMIDPSKYESDVPIYSDEMNDLIRGKAADIDVEIEITRHYTEKTEAETYYDYLKKENVTRYNYESKEECVGTYDISTVNGKAQITDLALDAEDSYYSIEFRYKDTKGRKTVEVGNVYNYHYNKNDDIKNYTLEADSNTFKEDQIIKFDLLNNGAKEKGNSGRIFVHVYGTEFIDTAVYDGTSFSHKMTAKYIPTVNVSGAYFDGRHIYPINASWNSYSFDPEERKLEISLESDREKYAPGGKAAVTAYVKDASGKAVQGAAVNLSVVDEAIFDVAPQNADPLNEIYRDIFIPYINQFYSYNQYSLDGSPAGEMGGGGDEPSGRKDFKDTAAFVSAVTDAEGKAEFEIELPDNITEWRATAVAVYEKATDVVLAGAKKAGIIVTQPMFIEPVMLSELIEGDELSVYAVCFGDSTGDETITVTVSGNGVNETKTTPSGRYLSFGKLSKGEYTVKFSAENDNASDSIELPLTVTDTILETRVTESFDLADGLDINPDKWPACVTFYDKQHMLYTDVLFKLTRQAGSRLDMRIASYFAMKEFGFITQEEYSSEFTGITPGGLASLLSYSEPDPELTALICAAAPELVDSSNVKNAMYEILDSEDSYHDHISAAYLALAALGEPVMAEIRGVLEEDAEYYRIEGMDDTDRLRLTAALALLGDYETALKYYNAAVSDMVSETDVNGKEMLHINGEDSIMLTQTALMTAAITGRPEADMMARYLVSSEQVYDSFALELMVYLKHYSHTSDSKAIFTYELDGKTETVELDRHFGTHIDFGEEQFKNADFKVTSGEVFAVACYTGYPLENDTDPVLKVKKTVTSENGEFTPGSLVTVRISVSGGDSKCSYYTVNDVVPSCGRFVSAVDCFADRNGQQVTLYTNDKGYAEYTFRIASSGEYVLESAAARNCLQQWGMSERSAIKAEGYDRKI